MEYTISGIYILYTNTEKWFILSILLKNSIKFLMVSILVGLNLDES